MCSELGCLLGSFSATTPNRRFITQPQEPPLSIRVESVKVKTHVLHFPQKPDHSPDPRFFSLAVMMAIAMGTTTEIFFSLMATPPGKAPEPAPRSDGDMRRCLRSEKGDEVGRFGGANLG